jgi:hypothetical protein
MIWAHPRISQTIPGNSVNPRYTHRVAISNRRLISLDEAGVTFRYKDYRRDGAERYRTMTLATDDFIRRFMLQVLPKGFHRIRHYGLFASAGRGANVARARALLAVPPVVEPAEPVELTQPRPPCPCCAGAGSSSKPSNAGCSRPRRQPLPHQPR